jgi:hypothetical protein
MAIGSCGGRIFRYLSGKNHAFCRTLIQALRPTLRKSLAISAN